MAKNKSKNTIVADAEENPQPVSSQQKPQLALISTDCIVVERNIRSTEPTLQNDPALLDLADSIRQVGIIEPLIVNQAATNFTLVAGHRRLAAARHAGVALVPVLVYSGLTYKEVLNLQIVENIQRTDLSPIEEANVYVAMRDDLDMAVEDIAARAGRSTRHIYRYIGLLKLPQAAIDKIGEEIPITKALILATLPERIVADIVENKNWILFDNTAKDLPDTIKRIYLGEFNDSFDKERTYTDSDGKTLPPCGECPHRKQMELFVEYMDDNTCPNIYCFRAKRIAANMEKRAADEDDDDDDNGAQLSKDDDDDDDDNGAQLYKDDDDDDDDDDDNGAQLSKEERERLAADFAERIEKDETDQMDQAEKDYEIADYYLGHRMDKGFSPQDLFFCDTECSEVGYSDDSEYGEVYDRLLNKYVGKPFAYIKESGSAIQVIMATIVYNIYEKGRFNGYEIAKWIGCEEYKEEYKESED